MNLTAQLKQHVGHESYALDLIRMFLGLALFIRGALFITNQEPVLTLIEETGISFIVPVILVHYVALGHLVGGIMMTLGLLTRWAALIQIPILTGAVAVTALREGVGGPAQSLELAALVLFLLCVYFFFGSGRWSLDHFVFEREDEPDAIRSHEDVEADSAERTRAPARMRLTREHVSRYPGVCSCGHGKDDFWVSPEPEYSLGAASVGVLLGIAAGTPVRVVYRCRKCDEIVDATTDPDVLARFTRK